MTNILYFINMIQCCKLVTQCLIDNIKSGATVHVWYVHTQQIFSDIIWMTNLKFTCICECKTCLIQTLCYKTCTGIAYWVFLSCIFNEVVIGGGLLNHYCNMHVRLHFVFNLNGFPMCRATCWSISVVFKCFIVILELFKVFAYLIRWPITCQNLTSDWVYFMESESDFIHRKSSIIVFIGYNTQT